MRRGDAGGSMRGEDRTSGALFSYVDVEARIPAQHPLRAMRGLTNAALAELDARFSGLYEGIGGPSIPPERLLRASLLQLLYSIRSERQLVERLEFDMLFQGSGLTEEDVMRAPPRHLLDEARRIQISMEADPEAARGAALMAMSSAPDLEA